MLSCFLKECGAHPQFPCWLGSDITATLWWLTVKRMPAGGDWGWLWKCLEPVSFKMNGPDRFVLMSSCVCFLWIFLSPSSLWALSAAAWCCCVYPASFPISLFLMCLDLKDSRHYNCWIMVRVRAEWLSSRWQVWSLYVNNKTSILAVWRLVCLAGTSTVAASRHYPLTRPSFTYRLLEGRCLAMLLILCHSTPQMTFVLDGVGAAFLIFQLIYVHLWVCTDVQNFM